MTIPKATKQKAMFTKAQEKVIQFNDNRARAATMGISAASASYLASRNNHSDIISECRQLYRTTGIIRNITDLMTDFAIGGIDIFHEDEKEHKFYQGWKKIVDLPGVASKIARGCIRDGTAPIYAIDAKLDKATIKQYQSIAGPLLENEQKKNTIPVQYRMLDPVTLVKSSGLFGNKTIFMKIDRKIRDIIIKSNKTLQEKLMVENVPKEIVAYLNKNKQAEEVPVGMDEDDPNLTMLYYKKDDYQDWPDPIAFAVLDDIKYKKILRAADVQAAQNIIEAITVIKLFQYGKEGEKRPATPGQLNQMADMLLTPVNVKTMLWGSTDVEISTAYPPVESILGTEKYKTVDNDILSAYGVSQVIVNGGEGGNYSNSFLSVKTLMEKLETIRAEVRKWLEKELYRIMQAFGWKKMPVIHFEQMNLRDETAEKQVLLSLFDRHALSTETMLDAVGRDINIEKSRMEKEKKLGLDVISPFDKIKQSRLNTPDLTQDDFDPKGPGNKGRPKNKKSPQQKIRDTKPKGMGGAIELLGIRRCLTDNYSLIEEEIYNHYCAVNNVKNKKSLPQNIRDEAEQIIFAVFSNYGIGYIPGFASVAIGKNIPCSNAVSENFDILAKDRDLSSLPEIREARIDAVLMFLEEEAEVDSCVN